MGERDTSLESRLFCRAILVEKEKARQREIVIQGEEKEKEKQRLSIMLSHPSYTSDVLHLVLFFKEKKIGNIGLEE